MTAEEGFITAVAPGSFARRQNRYYGSDEAFLQALAEALREEYKAIIEAGFVLQAPAPFCGAAHLGTIAVRTSPV